MVRASDARQIIVQSLEPVPTESCPLLESYGRILATTVIAPHDVPPFDNSGMDGYAVRSADLKDAGEHATIGLTLQAEIPAGTASSNTLQPRSAIRIMTGAPIPQGADAVAEQEMVETRNGTIFLQSPVQPRRNVRRRGEDVRAGSVVLQKGMRLTSARVGVLASLGIHTVTVSRNPRVALLTTGNELVEIDATPQPGQIRNSNAVTLTGIIRELGCEVIDLGIARDNPDDLRKKIREGLEYDALVTSGGVSVGRYDYVLEALRTEGVDIKFWKVNVKPGMPFAFGVFNRSGGGAVPVFALPGNPVSSIVTFLQFARYGLWRLQGLEEMDSLFLQATLTEDIRKKDGKRHFMRGIVTNRDGKLIVRSTGSQSSAVLSSLAQANCLIHVPEESEFLPAGSTVEIELL